MLKVDQKAPEFELMDQQEKSYSLADFRGKWLLLYFYPKDFTPGCTTEACSFRDNFDKLKGNIQIVGVSKDTVESHKKFSEKYSLPFLLLSDRGGEASKAYGTDGVIFAKRTSFLIDPKGIVKKIYEKVKPASHVEEIIEDIKDLW